MWQVVINSPTINGSCSFDLIVRDMNSESKVCLQCGPMDGLGIFGLSASEFNSLSQTAKDDKMNEAEEAPLIFKVYVEYRDADRNTHTVGHSLKPLPMSVLAE